MQKIKYIMSIAITIVLLMVLSSCNKEDNSSTSEKAEYKEAKIMYVGIDENYEPYSYNTNIDEYAGFDVDLANEAFKRMGYKVIFVPIEIDNIKGAMERGQVKCIWSGLDIASNKDSFYFTDSYFTSGQFYLVREDSGINTFDELEGKELALRTSSATYYSFITDENDMSLRFSAIYSMKNVEDAFLLLKNNSVDALAGDYAVLNMLKYNDDSNIKYQLISTPIKITDYGVAFDKSEEGKQLRDKLNSVLSEMKKDGTIDSLVNKWNLEDLG